MKISRRRFTLGFSTLLMIPVGFLMVRCKGTKEKEPKIVSCDDFSKVSEADLQLRKSLAYVEVSPIEESMCSNCNLWLPTQNNLPCGGCTLFGGPVEAEGYCTYWAPQVDAG